MGKYILDFLPLVQGDLINNRFEIHELTVKRILSNKKINDIVNLTKLKDEILKEFKFENFPDELLNEIMERFIENNYLEKIDKNNYKIITKIEYKNISILINECYKEFCSFLKTKDKDFDPYIHKKFNIAFEECLFKIVSVFLEQEDFFQNQIETIDKDLINKNLIEIATSNGIDSPKSFVLILYEYLNSGMEKITNFIFFSYRGAITYDILRKGSLLSKECCDIGKGGLLILDTNTIISLVCITDLTHKWAESTIQLSRKLQFEICYTAETKDEYLRLLSSADYQMNLHKFFKGQHIADNQLIKDFVNRNIRSWGDYYALISNIELYLSSNYGIILKKIDNLNPDIKVMEYIEGIYPTVLQLKYKERFKEALDHDLYLLSFVTHFRKGDQFMAFNCPWILSFDTILNVVNKLTIDHFKLPYGYVLTPRYWLDTLLVFSNIEFNESNREDIVKAIMFNMIFPEKNILNLDQYAKIVANKIGLSEENQDFLKYVFTISPLKRNLEYALESNDVESASKYTSEILTDSDLLDKAISANKITQENAQLRKQLVIVGEKYRIVNAQKYLLEEVVTRPFFEQKISIVNADPNISKMIEVLIDKISQKDPEFFDKNKIPEIEVETTKEKAINYLTKIKNVIHQGNELAQDIKDLLPYIPTIIGLLKS